jgi:UDP-N-acetylglucosamine 2-epimerase (non-hydrolysing)
MEMLGSTDVHLIEPQDYFPFVYLMTKSYLIITDSGGIQEEAPSLRRPVLVTRVTTERPEALEAGALRLVGSSATEIFKNANQLLDNYSEYEGMAGEGSNPYGDGKAAQRIADILEFQT